jgi:hypothetical protein
MSVLRYIFLIPLLSRREVPAVSQLDAWNGRPSEAGAPLAARARPDITTSTRMVIR